VVGSGHTPFCVSDHSNRFVSSFKPRLQPSLGVPASDECARCA